MHQRQNNLVSRNKRSSKKAQKKSSRSEAIKLGATLILRKATSMVSTSSDSSEFLGRTFVCFDRKALRSKQTKVRPKNSLESDEVLTIDVAFLKISVAPNFIASLRELFF